MSEIIAHPEDAYFRDHSTLDLLVDLKSFASDALRTAAERYYQTMPQKKRVEYGKLIGDIATLDSVTAPDKIKQDMYFDLLAFDYLDSLGVTSDVSVDGEDLLR